MSAKDYENKVPVYVLIRTSARPVFFADCMRSIKAQTYENIITIVHTDNSADDYVEGDIIVRGKAQTNRGRGYYNLYNNTLLNAISVEKHGEGYYHFIDDDDRYTDKDVIKKLVKLARRDHVNVGRVRRWNNVVFPKLWKNQSSFQTECFFVHTDHRFLGTWWAKKKGDHQYSRQLTRILPINWLGPDGRNSPDFWTICSAQEGKGRGMRLDKGDPRAIKVSAESRIKISYVGGGLTKRQPVEVIYLKRVPGRMSKKGRTGQVKLIPLLDAEKLQAEGKVQIIGNPLNVKLTEKLKAALNSPEAQKERSGIIYKTDKN